MGKRCYTKLGNGGIERMKRCKLVLGPSGVRATVDSRAVPGSCGLAVVFAVLRYSNTKM